MKTKRNFVTIAAAAVLLTTLACILASCGKEVISLVPVYKGDTVTATDHVFTTDEFDIYLTSSVPSL